ncbi:MAG: GNAT family N-acetyltransferase [Proteobacteria bacterium]|nr:GNAT family N-acetyltransferase [Pseudomonadota bacterium]
MLDEQLHPRSSAQRKFALSFARNQTEMVEAQRLRYTVFAGEMGASLESASDGIDEDRFDAYCEHLLVRDVETAEVVGTYRVLSPAAASQAGGFYTEQEFDLARLAHLRGCMVEVGRSCIHPGYRSGGVIMLLWTGLLRYMVEHRHEYLIGCASISMADGGNAAASIFRAVESRHMSPIEYRVFPRCRLPLESLDDARTAALPPLVKGYLNVGAYVCGEPSWDPDFNCADLPVLLPLSRMDARYARHFSAKIA